MHREQRDLLKTFAAHIRPKAPYRILEVGSFDENGNHRGDFTEAGEYVGLDVRSGPNVDFVPADPYAWAELESESFDYVISGSAFEHIDYPWLTIREIARVLKRGGEAYIVAPSGGEIHRFPVDCWRIQRDGWEALGRWAGLDAIYITEGAGGPFNDIAAHYKKAP